MSQAETCSNYFEKAVYTLPERHRPLRHRLLNSEAYYMMFPEKAREMFIARNSDKCDSCCVSHGEALPPSNAEYGQKDLPHQFLYRLYR